MRSMSNMVNQLKSDYDFSIITRDTDYLQDEPYANIKSDSWNNMDGVQVYYCSKQ